MNAHAVEHAPASLTAQPSWSGNPVAWWLVEHGGKRVDPVHLFGALCQRLVAEGLPLWRASCGLATVRPELGGRQLVWRQGGEAEEVAWKHGVEPSHSGAPFVRRRLDGAAPALDFPLLEELAQAGASDYLALPLPMASGPTGYVSWAAARPGGFSDDELSLLAELAPLLALRLEVEAGHRASAELLETYLGATAARHVLAGEVGRGQGHTIHAAIWYSDLRGFTAMADRLGAGQVIAVLNDYFDAMVGAVHGHGGEVLKFIGDGLLAVFNVDGSSADSACCQAADAAQDALAAMAALNAGRRRPLEFGLALHMGDVVYGNIGASGRLDFTVIGPAVNEATRLEALSRSLGQPVLISASFAQSCQCRPLVSLGHHPLRGVAEPQEVFTLAGKTGGPAPCA
jgi:adenylate cyclase